MKQRLGETVAAYHRNNAEILRIETERRANWLGLVLRYAEREQLTERETDKAVRSVMESVDSQGRGNALKCD
jgi:hypothetical protein